MGYTDGERRTLLRNIMELPEDEEIRAYVIVAHVHVGDSECEGLTRVGGNTETAGDAVVMLGTGAVSLMQNHDPEDTMTDE